MINIAIFASGSGSNAEEIIKHFKNNDKIYVCLILANNAQAYVLERAKNHNIPYRLFNKKDFYESDVVMDSLIENKIDFIVLAGFLWLIPKTILEKYQGKILNIHPALLPLYGGKGMYGNRVHQAVIDAREKETGITIHFVDELYDKGAVIFQAKCPVSENDTVESIQQRVHELEHKYFPSIIEKTIRETFKI